MTRHIAGLSAFFSYCKGIAKEAQKQKPRSGDMLKKETRKNARTILVDNGTPLYEVGIIVHTPFH